MQSAPRQRSERLSFDDFQPGMCPIQNRRGHHCLPATSLRRLVPLKLLQRQQPGFV